MTTETKIYQASCFCGAVHLLITGKPNAMGYCHCQDCRHWSAGPVNAFTLWQRESVRVMQGADAIGSYQKTPNSIRTWCTVCGGHLYTDHPAIGLTDVYAALLPDLPFRPELHVHYQETVLPIRDGLPKMKDVPEAIGGSGVVVAE